MDAKLKLAHETPGWWNPRGYKMEIGTSGTMLTGEKADLLLRSKGKSPAWVRINQVFTRNKYTLGWHVSHNGGLDPAFTCGGVELSSLDLRRMFCFDDGVEEADRWMTRQYRGTTAVQGKYLRQGRYLNIPGPGIGRDGDANISVFVSDGIMKGVRDLLAARGHMSA